MSSADHDSNLNFLFGTLADLDQSGSGELPVLDLNSSEPLTFDDLPVIKSSYSKLPTANSSDDLSTLGGGGDGRQIGETGSSMWLEGDVLMCPCPECRAPMSIRTWLMVADCWQCGMSIELSEDQEREASRLLAKREEALAKQRQANSALTAGARASAAPVQASPADPAKAPASKANTPPPPPPPPPTTTKKTTEPTTPKTRPKSAPDGQAPVATSRKQTVTQRKVRRKVAGGVEVWLAELFRDMPAWVISMVLHLILITLLGLFYRPRPQEEELIILSAEISTRHNEGEDMNAVIVENEEVHFDLPIPPKDKLKTEQQKKVLMLADQDARELRIDPNTNDPSLPPLDTVKEIITNGSVVQRGFAARDPRVRVEMVQHEGGTTETEAAVARALRWIALQQNTDGGWGLNGRRSSDAAATSLALMPYLGAGQTHLQGRYQQEVAQGLRWMLQKQKPDGSLSHGNSGNPQMYAHGQATIVLCEAFALTGDENFRRPAQKAVDFIVKSQGRDGGWRYKPREPVGDLSVVGWQLMALQSARTAGLTVPEHVLENGGHFLDSVQHSEGAQYYYMAPRKNPSETMTAEGLLSRMYLGWTKEDPGLVSGVDFLAENHLPQSGKPNIYYWYYGTQVMHHMGGENWDKWNKQMREILVRQQNKQGTKAGSWSFRSPHSQSGGDIYTTALATCTLEIYYRHAPLFKRIDLD